MIFVCVFLLIGIYDSLAQSGGFDEACKIINSLPCSTTTQQPVCGSNGVLYNNECLFAKAQCGQPQLDADATGAKCVTTTQSTTVTTTPNMTSSLSTTVDSMSTPDMGNMTTMSTPDMGNMTTMSTPDTGNMTTMSTPDMGNMTTMSTPDMGNMTTMSTPDMGNMTTMFMSTPDLTNVTTTMQTVNVTSDINFTTSDGMSSVPTTMETINVTMDTNTTADVIPPNVTMTTSVPDTNATDDTLASAMTPTDDITTIQTTTTNTAISSTLSTDDLSPLCKIVLANSCPDEYSPVCATGSVEYSSLCTFTQAQCYNPDLTITKGGSCSPTTTTASNAEGIICQAITSNPCNDDGVVLCGSNGVTYINSCEYEKERCVDKSLTVVKPGKC